MAEVLAGAFHAVQTIDGLPHGLTQWRVTTAHQGVAGAVGRLLGGTPRLLKAAGDGGWEILTEAASVRVAVDFADATSIGFRLADADTLGRFVFSSAPWTVREMFGDISDHLSRVGGWGALACLAIRPVEIRTLTGMNVLHLVPSVTVLAG